MDETYEVLTASEWRHWAGRPGDRLDPKAAGLPEAVVKVLLEKGAVRPPPKPEPPPGPPA